MNCVNRYSDCNTINRQPHTDLLYSVQATYYFQRFTFQQYALASKRWPVTVLHVVNFPVQRAMFSNACSVMHRAYCCNSLQNRLHAPLWT